MLEPLPIGEILAEHNRFIEKISTRTKTAPWKHFQYDKNGLSYWKIKSPEYYKSNPEEFTERVAVSNYIDGILLVWSDMRERLMAKVPIRSILR